MWSLVEQVLVIRFKKFKLSLVSHTPCYFSANFFNRWNSAFYYFRTKPIFELWPLGLNMTYYVIIFLIFFFVIWDKAESGLFRAHRVKFLTSWKVVKSNLKIKLLNSALLKTLFKVPRWRVVSVKTIGWKFLL